MVCGGQGEVGVTRVRSPPPSNSFPPTMDNKRRVVPESPCLKVEFPHPKFFVFLGCLKGMELYTSIPHICRLHNEILV